MPDSLSELTQKYRDEMLNMYRSRRPPHCPPCPPPPRPEPPPPPRPPRPEPPPPPPPRPQPRGVLPVTAEPEEMPVLPEPVQEETPEIIEDPVEEIIDTDYEEPVLPEYIQPEPPPLPADWAAQDAYEKRNTAEGKLYVVASTADSAFPVPGARVTVYTRIGDKMHLNYLLVTNESGETPTVTLPAPPASLSQDPDNPTPYAVCDIKIYASGYFREEARNVPIFAGVTSRQEFQMIPLPSGVSEDAETIIFPSEISPV